MFVVFPYHNNIFVGRLLIDAKVSHDMDKVTGSKETNKTKGIESKYEDIEWRYRFIEYLT